MALLARVGTIALALAAVHLVIGLAISVVPNPEGWLGGVAYAVMYAVPLLLMGLALRGSRRGYHLMAGVFALILGAFYVITVTSNWAFYSSNEAIFAAGITIPTVALDLLVAWATLLHRPRHDRPSITTAA